MRRKFTVLIVKGEKWYVAHCLELEIVSQGKTVEEARENIREAVELFLESTPSEEIPIRIHDESYITHIEVDVK